MGVTNRNEVRYKRPESVSSTESLHIPISNSQTSLVSATGSAEHPANVAVPVRRLRRNNNPRDYSLSVGRNFGRRRQRRYTAGTELAALIEEDEPEEYLAEGIPHKSAFSAVLDNPEIEKVWDKFVEKDEQDQRQYLSDSAKKQPKKKTSYSNISSKIRLTFKLMRDFSELLTTEEEIIEFFSANPEKIYMKKDKNPYQRLIIHGVAQYYGLKSLSFNNFDDHKRTIKVINDARRVAFTEMKLVTMIKNNHKQFS